MSGPETDSLWLQKSITIPDPMPDVTGTTPVVKRAPPKESSDPAVVNTATESAAVSIIANGPTADLVPGKPETETVSALTRDQPESSASTPATAPQANTAEMELTRMLLDTSALGGSAPVASRRRSSVSRYSTARPSMSISSAAFISAHEYDELRAKYSQAKRELLKVSDVQKDLDFARFELTRAQEELKMLSKSTQALRQDVEDATARADRAGKARAALQSQLEVEVDARRKEVAFLKGQIDDLRHEGARRLAEMAEQQESESQGRVQGLRDELAALSAEVQSMAAQLDGCQRERDRALAEQEGAAVQLEAAQAAAEARERRVAELQMQLKDQCESHRRFAEEVQRDREEAVRSQQTLADQRAEQITRSKDACIAELREELRELTDKCRAVEEECAGLRHTTQRLGDDARRAASDHAKELRRVAEEHRLALCERDLQAESALREAKGTRAAVEEEGHSLRRQVAQASEELSTVAAVLAQRERQLGDADRELAALKERVLTLEQDNVQLASEAELNAAAADEAAERVTRLNAQKDSLEEEYGGDLRAAKERIRALEASLMEAREELSLARQEHIKADEDGRAATKDLRSELAAITAERDELTKALSRSADAEATAEDYRKRLAAEKQKSDALSAELSAAVGRCGTLERRLDEELRRAISRAVATKSPSSRQSPSAVTATQRQPSGLRVRSLSSTNGLPQGEGSSMKRARTEDARVFAISGFDGNEMLSSIKQLPNVAIAECKSNTPVPSNLTHLITNGQLTIKLLTALVRGCWVLPGSYVVDSLKARTWLSEQDYGFQHEDLPLLRQRVYVTDAFSACKHYSTASLLLREGGAVIGNEVTSGDADMVLCTNHELADYKERGMSWEKMVELIYPVRVE